MSKVTTSIVSICAGAALASPPFLYGDRFSMSNVVNLLQVIVGVLLLIHGLYSWFADTGVANRSVVSSPSAGAVARGVPTQSNKTSFERYYALYFKYLLASPSAVALIFWVLTFKVFGCSLSGASMEVYGCTAAGKVAAYLLMFSALLAAAMLALFIPLTIVVIVHAIGSESSSK